MVGIQVARHQIDKGCRALRIAKGHVYRLVMLVLGTVKPDHYPSVWHTGGLLAHLQNLLSPQHSHSLGTSIYALPTLLPLPLHCQFQTESFTCSRPCHWPGEQAMYSIRHLAG